MKQDARTNQAMVTERGDRTFDELRKLARSKRTDVHKTILRFCLERFTHRVFTGEHAERFALKGGLIVMMAEGVESQLQARATSDVDIQVPSFKGTQAEFEDIMRSILSAVPVEDDGVRFDVSDMRVEFVRDFVPGCALSLPAYVGRSKIRVKADVTFDARSVVADLVRDEIPSLLPGMAPVRVSRVPFEHAVADKVQALVRHGAVNYRMRDYYDLFVILTRDKAPDVTGAADAMRRTFALFDTPIPATVDEILALTDANAEARLDAWDREKTAKGFHVPTPSFPDMVGVIRERIAPIVEAAQPGIGLSASGGRRA